MSSYVAAAGGGNWNSTATWGGTGYPIAGDTATLTSSSGAVTVNVASACAILNMSGYASTMTMSNNLTCSGNITLGGTFSGTGAIVTTSATTQTLTPNSVSIPALTVSMGGTKPIGTLSLGGNLTVTGLYTHTKGSVNNYQITCAGGYTGSGSVAGTTSLVFSGGTITSSGTCVLNASIAGNITINAFAWGGTGKTFSYSSGTVTVGAGTQFRIDGGTVTTPPANVTWKAVSMFSGAVTLGDDLTCENTFTGYTGPLNGYTLRCGGYLGASGITGTTNIICTGGSINCQGQSISNNFTIAGNCSITDLKIAGGTCTYESGAITATLFTIAGNSTLDLSGLTWTNAKVTTNASVTLTSDFNCATLTHDTNTILTVSGGGTVHATTALNLSGTTEGYASIVSSSATPVTLTYDGTDANCKVFRCKFVDIDASTSAQPIVTWFGGSTRSPNVYAMIPADLTATSVTAMVC